MKTAANQASAGANLPLEEIKVGDILVARSPVVFHGTTSSSIILFVYSPRTEVCGIGHFASLLSPHQAGPEISRLDQQSRDNFNILIEALKAENSGRRQILEAKIFGGAYRDGNLSLGVLQQLVRRHNITIVGGDFGETCDREVFVFSDSRKARVRSLSPNPELTKVPSLVSPGSPVPLVVVKAEQAPEDTKSKLAQENEHKKIKVLIVDDSKAIRDLLTKILVADPLLEIVGVAENPLEAEKLVAQKKPDVITLDIHMPIMDGITFLQKFMPIAPLPVVMITSLSMEDSDLVLKALELGAIDYIQKPKMNELKHMAPMICEKVRMAASAKLTKKKIVTKMVRPIARNRKNDVSKPKTLIAIGSSTGGTEAIREILTALPPDIPPIVIVQHIPPVFSKSFAQRLNELCDFEVKEAQDGDELMNGRVLIAPGGLQMRIESSRGGWIIRLSDEAPINRHKPSVDVLFDSVVKHAGPKALGILLTGMGNDGASGLLAMKNAGSHTIAQDESSCVVFGMPKEAIKLGAACEVKPLDEIARLIKKI